MIDGIENSAYQHNSYTEALRNTIQFNRHGPLREGTRGNSLKGRSAGLGLRHNWIEAENRQLGLVDAGSRDLVAIPEYRLTHVYGNVLIETPEAGNRQIVHYGGDGESPSNYRKGTLLFYHNTVVSWRTERSTLSRLSTDDERCDARNTIFYVTAPGRTLSLTDSSGRLELRWAVTFDELRGAFHQRNGHRGRRAGLLLSAMRYYPCQSERGIAAIGKEPDNRVRHGPRGRTSESAG